jgi:trigger factor
LEQDPTVRPQVEVTKFSETECEFTAKIGLPPVVELGDLTGIPVDRPGVDITDEDVERQLEDLRRRKGTREAITDRGVQEGDVAVVNIKPDFEDGEGRTFMTLVGQTFAALDVALRDMRVEEVKHLDLTFPDSFQEKDWAGKTMSALVTLNSVSNIRLPELDDAFAQSFKSESLDELKAKIREGMERAVSGEVEKIVGEQLLDGLLERSNVQVSDNMWEPIADQRLAEVAQEQRKEGKSLDDYAQEHGVSVEELRNAWRDKAKQEVMRALVVREIYKREDMKLTNEDLNAELDDMARESGVTNAEMVKLLEQAKAMNELQFRAISRKVREFLAAKAEVKRTPVGAKA